MSQDRNLETIEAITAEHRRLENIIAIKREELREAIEALQRFDENTRTLSAWSSLV